MGDLASPAANAIVGGPFGSDLVSSDYVDVGVPVIRGQNMGERMLKGPYVFVSPQKAKTLEANLARPGDLVFTQRGTLGQVSKVPSAPFSRYLVSQSQMKVSLDLSRAHADFVLHSFRSARGQWLIQNSAIQTGVPHINVGIFRKLPILLPPLAEQEAIAEALSDVDALIESLEQLIAKKRLIKQGAMQELLTGKRRLPGFEGEWATSLLGEVGSWYSGGTPSKRAPEYWSGDIPWVSPKDMKVPRLYDSIDHVSHRALGRGTRLLPAGAVLVVVRGMILAHSAPVARAERELTFNQDIKGLVVRDGVDSNYILWWLRSSEQLLLSKTTESTHGTKRLPSESLLKLPLPLPAPGEQAAIATVLTDMDSAIHVLQAKLSKARQVKQGMMHNLLTGKIRLP